MTNSDITDVDMSGLCVLNGSIENGLFDGTDMKECKFAGCDLTDAKFVNCKLGNIAIRSSQISGMTIDGIPLKALLEKYYQ